MVAVAHPNRNPPASSICNQYMTMSVTFNNIKVSYCHNIPGVGAASKSSANTARYCDTTSSKPTRNTSKHLLIYAYASVLSPDCILLLSHAPRVCKNFKRNSESLNRDSRRMCPTIRRHDARLISVRKSYKKKKHQFIFHYEMLTCIHKRRSRDLSPYNYL